MYQAVFNTYTKVTNKNEYGDYVICACPNHSH